MNKDYCHGKVLKHRIEQWFFWATIAGLVAFYSLIINLYFEQDEWHNFGWHIFYLTEFGISGALYNAFFSTLAITQLFNLFNYILFGLNNVFPAVVVLFLIAANSFIWYKNIRTVSGDEVIAIGSLLFGYLSFISLQSIIWVIPAVAMQLSFLFVNLAIFFILRFIDTDRLLWVVISCTFAMLAFFTKLNSIFIFLFLPFVYFVVFSKSIWFEAFYRRKLVTVIVIGALLALFSMNVYVFSPGVQRVSSDFSQSFLNIFYLPMKAFSQIMISNPSTIYRTIDVLIVSRYKLAVNDEYAQTIITEHVSIMFSCILLFVGALLYRICSGYNKRAMLFAVGFYITSFFPYAFDKNSVGNGFLESRYYYIASFGAGLLLFILLAPHIWNVFRWEKSSWKKRIIGTFICTSLLVYFFVNAVTIHSEIANRILIGQSRQQLISFLKTDILPKNGGDFILFISEKNDEVVGKNAVGRYMQTGLLYPLLVDMFDSGYISHKHLETDALWRIDYQGVHDVDGQKVGLFYDRGALQEYLDQSSFPIEKVVAIEFDYGNIKNHSKYSPTGELLNLVQYQNITNATHQKMHDSYKFSCIGMYDFAALLRLSKNNPYPDATSWANLKMLSRNVFVATNARTIQYQTYVWGDDKISAGSVIIQPDGLENTYGGPYMSVYLGKLDVSDVHVPMQIAGYDLGFVQSIKSGEKTLQGCSVKKQNNIFVMQCDSNGYEFMDNVIVTFGLNGATFYQNERLPLGDPYVLQSKNVVATVISDKKVQVALNGELKSLRARWKNDVDRYIPIAFVNGKEQQIVAYQVVESGILIVELAKKVKVDDVVDLPVLIKSNISKEERVCFRYQQHIQ